MRAKQSWDKVFSAIYYFNEPEIQMEWANTTFIRPENPDERPQIKVIAKRASEHKEWVALINADIVVSPNLAAVEYTLDKLKGVCAISRRFVWPDGQRPEDWGLDFFCATPEVWLAVSNQIPEQFTLGRIRFDTWLCTFFAMRYPKQCYDLTPNRLIFHPNHGEREDQHLDDPDDYYIQHPAYPRRLIKI